MKNEDNRNTAVLYTTATCNLTCRYCYIDKNPALQIIDDILDTSFESDYYYDCINNMYPYDTQLTRLEIWGGEPFLRMDRVYNVLDKIISRNKSLNTIFSSTNMSFEDWNKQFFGLINVFGNHPNRTFDFELQISIDGPEEINDMQRGNGVTRKILNNIDLLLQNSDKIPNNIRLHIHLKSTIDTYSMYQLLTKESIISYYKFFDNIMDNIISKNISNIIVYPSIPNFASPSICTKDDGIAFKKMVSLTRAIENESYKYFKYYNIITPFHNDIYDSNKFSLKYENFTCGSGFTMLGFLPYNKISICHNGFVDLITDYKELMTENPERTIDAKLFIENSTHEMIKDMDKYLEYERQMSFYRCSGTTARLSSIVTQILLLAHAGLIDKKFMDEENARKAGIFYQYHASYCIRDNLAISGSKTMIHNGHLKLFFNGAYEYILGEKNES